MSSSSSFFQGRLPFLGCSFLLLLIVPLILLLLHLKLVLYMYTVFTVAFAHLGCLLAKNRVCTKRLLVLYVGTAGYCYVLHSCSDNFYVYFLIQHWVIWYFPYEKAVLLYFFRLYLILLSLLKSKFHETYDTPQSQKAVCNVGIGFTHEAVALCPRDASRAKVPFRWHLKNLEN